MLYDEHLADIKRQLSEEMRGVFVEVLTEAQVQPHPSYVHTPESAARRLGISLAAFKRIAANIPRSKPAGEYRYMDRDLIEYFEKRKRSL